MKLYSTVYQTKAPDYEGIFEKARYYKIKLETGGGRKSKGGESPNAQIVFNLGSLNSKISVARTGRVIIYYPSNVRLKKCVDILVKCYMPPICKTDLKCRGPTNPLSKAFVLRTTENWEGRGLKLSEAIVNVEEWYDTKTGEYVYVIPNDDGVVVPPVGPNLVYSDCCKITIAAIDKDDEEGKRIVTGERLRWQFMEEIKRISKEHNRLTPEDLRKAILRDRQHRDTKV